jgi:hypothetical protein
MQVITGIETAYNTALPYIMNASRAKMKKHDANHHDDPVPKHATSSRWEMTPQSLRNTLNYIYYKLGYNCYMLCVDLDGKKVLCKLESTSTSDGFREALDTHLSNLDSNRLITESQRDYIRKVASKPVRIMQCILKNYSDLGNRTEPMNEYMKLLENLALPPGVFILNLSDAVILRRDNKEPFPMVTGDMPIESMYRYESHLPIFSLSGQKGYADIPFPNYDDMFIATSQKQVNFDDYVVDWDKKTLHKAVFRGGPSGCGYTAETNQRIRLAKMKSPLLDAKIVVAGKTTIDSNSIKFDPVHGLGMLNTGIASGNFLSMVEQSKYKYIIHVDGNVNAYRLLTTMMTGSLIIRVDSPYISWVDHLLKPGRDYVLVKPDMSDLLAKIRWCEAHPKSARKMARNGYEFAKSVLTQTYVGNTVEKLFWSLRCVRAKNSRKTRKIRVLEPMAEPISRHFEEPISSSFEKPASSYFEEPVAQPVVRVSTPVSTPVPTPVEQPVAEPVAPIEYEIIEFPPNAKKCPNGYNSVTIKKKKMCRRKKNQTQKAE